MAIGRFLLSGLVFMLLFWGCRSPDVIPDVIAVGFAYDGQDDEPGGALILDVVFDDNAELLKQGDYIVGYRGIPVNSGRELDALIDRLDDVGDGDTISMMVRSPESEEAVALQVVAKKREESGTKNVVYSSSICTASNAGRSCNCASGVHTCTKTKEWRRDPAKPKKFQHRFSCTDDAGNNCGPSGWFAGK